MKNIICIISCILFSILASAQNPEDMIYNEIPIAIYENPYSGSIPTGYLILNRLNKSYNTYSYTNSGSIGIYQIMGDTLVLIPKYDYIGEWKLKEIDTIEYKRDFIEKYLIRADTLENITLYPSLRETVRDINSDMSDEEFEKYYMERFKEDPDYKWKGLPFYKIKTERIHDIYDHFNNLEHK